MPNKTKKKKKNGVGNSDDTAAIEGAVVVGTYEGALLGFNAADGTQIFGYAPHSGCVKALSCNDRGFLASGGTDHAVKLFDLSKGIELGELQEHQDTVSGIGFWGKTTAVTSGDDGLVCIWRCSDWELLNKFKAHKTAITSLAVHPSGKLLATSARDKTLRLWDLTRGTSAASLTLEGEPAEDVQWSPGGTHIAALSSRELQIINATSGESATFRDPSSSGFMRVTLSAQVFLSESAVVVGDARGVLRLLRKSTQKPQEVVEVCRLPEPEAANGSSGEGLGEAAPPPPRRQRVKALARGPPAGDGSVAFAVGMSDGLVEVWHASVAALSADGPEAQAGFSAVFSVATHTRLTSLTAWFKDPSSKEMFVSLPLSAPAGPPGKAGKRKADGSELALAGKQNRRKL